MARKRSEKHGGDILGLGDIAPNREHVEGMAREDDAERRRRRMSEGADELTPEPSSPSRHSGATGIDMGSGGEGTDIDDGPHEEAVPEGRVGRAVGVQASEILEKATGGDEQDLAVRLGNQDEGLRRLVRRDQVG